MTAGQCSGMRQFNGQGTLCWFLLEVSLVAETATVAPIPATGNPSEATDLDPNGPTHQGAAVPAARAEPVVNRLSGPSINWHRLRIHTGMWDQAAADEKQAKFERDNENSSQQSESRQGNTCMIQ